MDNPARYCENCGKPLNAQARFCGQCGKPVPLIDPAAVPRGVQPAVAAPPAQAGGQPTAPPAVPRLASVQQAAPAPQEPVIGVIPNGTRKKGVFGLGGNVFHVVITNRRLIFARQTNDMMVAERQQAKDAAKAQGKGFFGQWGAIAFSSNGTRYFNMPAEVIAGEHPDNFSYSLQQIYSVKSHFENVEGGSNMEYQLIFDTSAGKLVLSYASLNEKEAKNLLRRVLGGAVK